VNPAGHTITGVQNMIFFSFTTAARLALSGALAAAEAKELESKLLLDEKLSLLTLRSD